MKLKSFVLIALVSASSAFKLRFVDDGSSSRDQGEGNLTQDSIRESESQLHLKMGNVEAQPIGTKMGFINPLYEDEDEQEVLNTLASIKEVKLQKEQRAQVSAQQEREKQLAIKKEAENKAKQEAEARKQAEWREKNKAWLQKQKDDKEEEEAQQNLHRMFAEARASY